MSFLKACLILAAVITLATSDSACGLGKYLDELKFECLSCPSECLTCRSQSYCTACSFGLELVNGACRDNHIDRTATILGVAIGAAIGLFCLIQIIKTCIKNRCRRQAQGENNMGPSSQSIENLNNQKNEVAFWENVQQQIKLQQICVICQDSPGNLELSCNHRYHIGCIRIWMKKIPSCPLCRSNLGVYAKVICTGCHKSAWKARLRGDAIITEPSKCSQCINI